MSDTPRTDATLDACERTRDYANEKVVDLARQLERELEEIGHNVTHWQRRCGTSEIDAERYRYLRKDRRILNAMPYVREFVHRQLREEWRLAYPHGGPGAFGPVEDRHIDAAVDAAREKEKKETI